MRKRYLLLICMVALMPISAWAATQQTTVTVGSKKFTESVILGDIAAGLARAHGAAVLHRKQLGGTRVLWEALRSGDIDVYPEYTGTLRQEIFHDEHVQGRRGLRAALARYGIGMTAPLGFSNNYVLGMRESEAAKLGINTISDLQRYPALRFGFSNEFMARADGWPGLQAAYHLPQRQVRGLDHDLAYRGIAAGQIDVIDMYSTDADIDYYHLRALQDDRHYFPQYQAVYLYRLDLAQRMPAVTDALGGLAGRISAAEMRRMNGAVKLRHEPDVEVAAAFLHHSEGVVTSGMPSESAWHRFLINTRDHLTMVGISLSLAIIVAIPLGVVAALQPRTGRAVLGVASIVQTIHSLALFAFMIPLLGIGTLPAVVALFLYSLLPIIRNTYSGLKDIPTGIRESAVVLGLPLRARLARVELPLASRSILSGIKTAAVINVGTATLGALIGAGGYGQPILTGIRLDDTGLILQGAIPAACLALLVQGLFDLAEKIWLPRALRSQSGS